MLVKQASDHVRADNVLYPTPVGHIRAALRHPAFGNNVPQRNIIRVLDPGAGDGRWGLEMKKLFSTPTRQQASEPYESVDLTGIELRPAAETGPHPEGYANWHTMDFAQFRTLHNLPFDVVIGNPPFGRPRKNIIEEFIWHGRDLLSPDGVMMYLHRIEFLTGQKRAKKLWSEYRPRAVLLSPVRPSFTGNKKTDAQDYCFSVWGKEGVAEGETRVFWLDPEGIKLAEVEA